MVNATFRVEIKMAFPHAQTINRSNNRSKYIINLSKNFEQIENSFNVLLDIEPFIMAHIRRDLRVRSIVID